MGGTRALSLNVSSNQPQMDVVIDKSVLQGMPKERLQLLFKDHRVLMTQALFYELLTAKPAERASCFRRIPAIDNPVVLVQNVGPILQWEVTNERPLVNIDDVAISVNFNFNPGLVNEDFDLGEEQAGHIENWKKEMSASVSNFADHCSKVTVRFPELKGYYPGMKILHIEEIKTRVCTDPGFVRQLYSAAEGSNWPTAEEIDERWAIYRWLQIRVVAALDYLLKYGERDVTSLTTKVENEYLDLEYCLVGCLVGAIATKDSGMSERFLAVSPLGKVLA